MIHSGLNGHPVYLTLISRPANLERNFIRMLVSFKVILAADLEGRLLSLPNTHHWNTNLSTLGEGGSLRVKQPGEEVDADLGHNILELIKVHKSRQSLTNLNLRSIIISFG